jgi:hypothetical protein
MLAFCDRCGCRYDPALPCPRCRRLGRLVRRTVVCFWFLLGLGLLCAWCFVGRGAS